MTRFLTVSGQFARWTLLLMVLTFIPIAAFTQTLHDDFAAEPAGSDGGPAWEPWNETWRIADGAYVGDTGISCWRGAPFASAMTFACNVTVLETNGDEWLTAGVGLATDDKNYWALNLIVTPESQGRQHRTELQECVNGFWPAAGDAATRLKPLPGRGADFNWHTHQTYRLEISLSQTNISGRILDDGNEVVRFGYELTGGIKAVRAGRPILRVNGMRARFDHAVASIAQVAPEPKAAASSIPAWIMRPDPAITNGSGFFRTAEVDGRWWLVDPEGKPFFAIGTDHVNYHAHFCEKLGYAPYHRNVQAKFGSEEAWAESAIERLKAWGFNELPAGHSPSLRHRGLPHMLFGSLGTSFARREWICEPKNWTGFPDVFSPRWESHCRFAAREAVRDSRGDPWCIGTFIDNELEWYGKQGQLVDEVFQLGPQAPAKKALWPWLLKQFGTVTELNHRLGGNYADEADFLTRTNVPQSSAALTQVRDGFLANIADRYFSVAAKALREADPDHLVLGCRFAGSVPDPVLAAAGKYNDVFTFNTYPRVDFENIWSPDGTGGVVERVPRELSGYFAVARKPILITEWSFPALDSGLPCRHGAGMRVDTQEQKADCYRIFVNAMADLPFLVGYDYFMWVDEPAAGISTSFPEDSNYGLVNEQDEPYAVLIKAATEVNRAAERRHAHSSASGTLELKTAGNMVEVINPNATQSHGLVRVSASGQSRVAEISLAAGQTQRLALAAHTVASVELQNWDGTKQRTLSGPPLGPLEVANVSAAPLADVPVLLDGTQPVAVWLRQLAPGEIETLPAPTNAWTKPDHLDLNTDSVTWSGSCKDGNLFDHIQAGDLALGRLVFALHQQIDGHDQWTECDRIVSLELQEQSDAWLIEAVVGFGETGFPNSFRAAVRLAVFKHAGLVLARPLWVENSGARNWKLVEAYWFCRPTIGGSTDDDMAGGADVPDYYRDAQCWTDTKRGGCFGALGQSEGWRVNYWKGSAADFHPDARFPVEQELPPGARWAAIATPYLWIFAGHDAAHWKKIAQLARQVETSLLTGADLK